MGVLTSSDSLVEHPKLVFHHALEFRNPKLPHFGIGLVFFARHLLHHTEVISFSLCIGRRLQSKILSVEVISHRNFMHIKSWIAPHEVLKGVCEFIAIAAKRKLVLPVTTSVIELYSKTLWISLLVPLNAVMCSLNQQSNDTKRQEVHTDFLWLA
jgi:hypothetical protein